MILVTIGLLFTCVYVPLAFAAGPYGDYTESDLRLLPPFCKIWVEHGRKRSIERVKKYGYRNIQHLCPGLNALNHALKQTEKKKRTFPLGVAADELTYVLTHSGNFPLRPVVLRKRGKVYEMQGEINMAITDYKEAIKLRPKYTSVYADLIDIYLKIGNKKEAANILKKGLKVTKKCINF